MWCEHSGVYGDLKEEAREELTFYADHNMEGGKAIPKGAEIVAYVRGNYNEALPYLWILKAGDAYWFVSYHFDTRADEVILYWNVRDALDHTRCMYRWQESFTERAFLIMGKQLFGRTFAEGQETRQRKGFSRGTKAA